MSDLTSNDDSGRMPDSTTNEGSESSTESAQPTESNSDSPSRSPESEFTAISLQIQGPLPSPAVLADFDRVLPGLAREIVDRSELEMKHRHEIEGRSLEAKIADRRAERRFRAFGQWMAFTLALSFGGGGVYLTVQGHPGVGGAMVSTTVIAVAGVFVTGKIAETRKTQHQESE